MDNDLSLILDFLPIKLPPNLRSKRSQVGRKSIYLHTSGTLKRRFNIRRTKPVFWRFIMPDVCTHCTGGATRLGRVTAQSFSLLTLLWGSTSQKSPNRQKSCVPYRWHFDLANLVCLMRANALATLASITLQIKTLTGAFLRNEDFALFTRLRGPPQGR